jgi:hypothetical protein
MKITLLKYAAVIAGGIGIKLAYDVYASSAALKKLKQGVNSNAIKKQEEALGETLDGLLPSEEFAEKVEQKKIAETKAKVTVILDKGIKTKEDLDSLLVLTKNDLQLNLGSIGSYVDNRKIGEEIKNLDVFKELSQIDPAGLNDLSQRTNLNLKKSLGSQLTPEEEAKRVALNIKAEEQLKMWEGSSGIYGGWGISPSKLNNQQLIAYTKLIDDALLKTQSKAKNQLVINAIPIGKSYSGSLSNTIQERNGYNNDLRKMGQIEFASEF